MPKIERPKLKRADVVFRYGNSLYFVECKNMAKELAFIIK
jgi:hypothetical protein